VNWPKRLKNAAGLSKLHVHASLILTPIEKDNGGSKWSVRLFLVFINNEHTMIMNEL